MNGTLDNKVINIASDKNYFALLSNGAKYDNLQIVSNSNETYMLLAGIIKIRFTPITTIRMKTRKQLLTQQDSLMFQIFRNGYSIE